MRHKTFAAGRALAVLRRPARFANVESLVTGLFVEQQCVIRLLVGKRLAAGLTGMGSRLNVPLGHEILFDCGRAMTRRDYCQPKRNCNPIPEGASGGDAAERALR